MGVKTLYEYFYKLAYGDKGGVVHQAYIDNLDVADAQIEANRVKSHTQGTDQKLDEGGASEVVVADVKDAVTKKHANTLDHSQNTDTDLDATFEATIAKKADKLNVFAATSSEELRGVISDEVGTGALMFASANGFASGAKGYKSAADQTIANDTFTKVVLDEEDFDILAEFDKTTNYRFTVQVAGCYLFIGQCYYYPSVDLKQYKSIVYKNGTSYQATSVGNSGTNGFNLTATGIGYLEVNDYLELYTYQASGANAQLLKGKDLTFLIVKRLY